MVQQNKYLCNEYKNNNSMNYFDTNANHVNMLNLNTVLFIEFINSFIESWIVAFIKEA